VTSPIAFPADNDPGGRDTVASDVAGAVANAQARYHELESDTFGQGSRIGDLLPGMPSLFPPFEAEYFPETNQNPAAGS
jgi:hypothetical protein